MGIRSYEVITEDGGGVYRRNRRHLRKTNEPEDRQRGSQQVQDDQEPQIVTEQMISASGPSDRSQEVDQHHPLEDPERVEQRQEDQAEDVRRTRSGRRIKLPERFRDFNMK